MGRMRIKGGDDILGRFADIGVGFTGEMLVQAPGRLGFREARSTGI
jgi:hypothetical protein